MSEPDGVELLRLEMALRTQSGPPARFFLRDDDAVADTARLRHLFNLAGEAGVPLLLACVPAPAEASLGRALRGAAHVTGAVHGYRHVSHAGPGQKPCELGGARPVDSVLDELRKGRTRLFDLFDGQLSGLVVPPWNRIEDAVAARVGEAGFAGVSAHGFQNRPGAGTTAFVNVHVDIIHWSGGRQGRGLDWAGRELARALALARGHGNPPIGLLAHHLDHDDQAWRTLAALLRLLPELGGRFVAADSALAGGA